MNRWRLKRALISEAKHCCWGFQLCVHSTHAVFRMACLLVLIIWLRRGKQWTTRLTILLQQSVYTWELLGRYSLLLQLNFRDTCCLLIVFFETSISLNVLFINRMSIMVQRRIYLEENYACNGLFIVKKWKFFIH